MAEKIIACRFDTTSSNTGIHKGGCTLLRKLLGRQILWLACRQHILELVVGAAFTELFGSTTGVEPALFKILKNSGDTLNLADIKLPDFPPSYQHELEDLLLFINKRLESENAANLPRCDYKEFLGLAKLILGGGIDSHNSNSYQIQRPGTSTIMQGGCRYTS